MSRYTVNKAMHQAVVDKVARGQFKADPHGYLKGRDLSPEEERALADLDYATLYRMGAHPFILWSFLLLVHPLERRALIPEYVAAVRPLGYPDIDT